MAAEFPKTVYSLDEALEAHLPGAEQWLNDYYKDHSNYAQAHQIEKLAQPVGETVLRAAS